MREFLSYSEAKEIVCKLGLKGKEQWEQYRKSDKKPANIPSNPSRIYKSKGWSTWGDWLGTGKVANRNKKYLLYREAREIVCKQGFQNKDQWEQYCASGNKPKNIPSIPSGKGWSTWGDWLGYDKNRWTIDKVQELLRALIESRVIYTWNEVDLYSLLHTKGVLNLQSSNTHSQFFKKLIEASHTEKGRQDIEKYAYSPDEDGNIPDLLSVKGEDKDNEEIHTVSEEELARLVNTDKTQTADGDPLDYGEIPTVNEILSSPHILESINADEETMKFFLVGRLDDLWKRAFKYGPVTISEVKSAGRNGNKFHDEIIDTFLCEYEGAMEMRIPNGYAFKKDDKVTDPTLMQLYTAYKIKTNPYFGNFSETGSGKTLSAVLASRVIDSKLTVIVCPNDVVGQWKDRIIEAFPDSNVILGKEAFYFNTHDNNQQHNYLVLNYDKFSQDDSPNLIINFVDQNRADFVILDEVHFTKIRYDDREASQRRRNLDGLLTATRKKNPDVKVLGLSATPVVNNLNEGKSLLELITGKVYDDVITTESIPNAVTLYQKLSTLSIREIPEYSIEIQPHYREVDAPRPTDSSIRYLKSNPLAIEQLLTPARIPEIIKCLKADGVTDQQQQSIIYTEYVTDVIEQLSAAVRTAGYSLGLYTGLDRSGLMRFLERKVQVLIASRPISVGVDGLQYVCNRLIINTLPWTNAQYQQLVGRLYRIGQTEKTVQVYIIKASLGGYPYDERKWNRILYKKTLADCAVDGRLPERNLVTPQQAAAAALAWLERLERGEVSTVTRRDVNVELTPREIERRLVIYGEFSQQNQKINTELSENTHIRLQKNPEEWLEYHRQLAIKRKSWTVDPLSEIMTRIKTMSSKLRIGDFGCGIEARLMNELGVDRVISFDHIAVADSKVIECDMKSVSEYVDDGKLEVVVFCLSLMGKNWRDYIAEAKRCLCVRGSMLIAQTTRELANGQILSELRDVIRQMGFVIDLDESRGDFTFIEATKI